MRLDEEENPVPDMAAEDPEISDDLKIWTFKIREDVEWSDGSPVTANDFEYAWKRAINPNKESSQYSFLFEAVGIKNANEILDSNSEIYGEIDELGVKAIDEKTLEVEFDYPQPFFKSILWFGPFLPLKEDFVENEGEEYAQEADKILYNGPYKMSEWNQGESWKWEKNEDYWDASSYHLEKVEFRVVKDLSTQVKLYEQGEIDQTDLKGEEMITKFQDNPEFEEGLEASTMSIRIGQRDSTLKNKKIRKALYNGINREGLTDILLNDGSVD